MPFRSKICAKLVKNTQKVAQTQCRGPFNNVLLGTTIIGKRWSSGFGTKELRIQFNSAATREIVQQLVRSITFKTVGGVAGQRDVLFSVSDSDHAISAETSKIVNMT